MRKKSSKRRSGLFAALFLELASLIGLVAIAQPAWFAGTLKKHLVVGSQQTRLLQDVANAALEPEANRSQSGSAPVLPHPWYAPQSQPWAALPSLPRSAYQTPPPGLPRPFTPFTVPNANSSTQPDGHRGARLPDAGPGSQPEAGPGSLGWLVDRPRWATRPHFPAVHY